MRKVRCHECGRIYDFDTDDFCPRCGAFTQPPKSMGINADGAVIRMDGLNEKNHAGSFVHAELHEENRERKRMGLSKGARRTSAGSASAAAAKAARSVSETWQFQTRSDNSRKKGNPGRIVFTIIFVIFAFNILTSLLSALLFW